MLSLNEQAWYMHEFQGMTYKEIGEELHHSGISQKLKRHFKAHITTARVVQRFHEYCKTECEDNHCKSCHLMQFVLKNLIRKKV